MTFVKKKFLITHVLTFNNIIIIIKIQKVNQNYNNVLENEIVKKPELNQYFN